MFYHLNRFTVYLPCWDSHWWINEGNSFVCIRQSFVFTRGCIQGYSLVSFNSGGGILDKMTLDVHHQWGKKMEEKGSWVFFSVRSPFFIFWGKNWRRKKFLSWETPTQTLENLLLFAVWAPACSFKNPICWAAWCLSRYPHSSLGYEKKRRGKHKKRTGKQGKKEKKKGSINMLDAVIKNHHLGRKCEKVRSFFFVFQFSLSVGFTSRILLVSFFDLTHASLVAAVSKQNYTVKRRLARDWKVRKRRKVCWWMSI